MRNHPQNRLRKFGPVVAAGLCVWGASGVADDFPESVRERALQELRVLDRAPSTTPRKKADAATHSVRTARPVSSPAKPSRQQDGTLFDDAAKPTEPFITTDASDPFRPTVQARQTIDEGAAPTISPARPSIVRPAIRARPVNWNPWDEVTQPVETNRAPASKPDSSAVPFALEESTSPTKHAHSITTPAEPNSTNSPDSDAVSEATQAPASQDGDSKTSAAPTPAASTGETPNATETPPASERNPFAVDAQEKQWRPTAVQQEAGPAQTIGERPSTPKADVAPAPKQEKIAAKATSSSTKDRRSKSEQLGADQPISVLDFLSQNVSAEPKKNIAATTSAPKAAESTPSAARPLASSSSATAAFAKGVAKIDAEDDGAKVVANGSARSVGQTSIPSDAPLQSISDIETHLETPPRDEHFAELGQPQSEQQKLEARSDRDGFMGFCPVTLRDQKSLVDGVSELTTIHREATFTFASPEAKAIFDADPERYAPANQGRDVVLEAAQISVAGSLRHATYYQNRLYLFRSEQTCRLFVADPVRYVTDAEADSIR